MEKLVSLKELRTNMAKYAAKVQAGESFIVLKQSKPFFRISPVDTDEQWEEVIDFTKIKKGGVPVSEIISRL